MQNKPTAKRTTEIYCHTGWEPYNGDLADKTCVDCGEPATKVTHAGGTASDPILWAHCDGCASYSAGLAGDLARLDA